MSKHILLTNIYAVQKTNHAKAIKRNTKDQISSPQFLLYIGMYNGIPVIAWFFKFYLFAYFYFFILNNLCCHLTLA